MNEGQQITVRGKINARIMSIIAISLFRKTIGELFWKLLKVYSITFEKCSSYITEFLQFLCTTIT